jgi:hypothetical protein
MAGCRLSCSRRLAWLSTAPDHVQDQQRAEQRKRTRGRQLDIDASVQIRGHACRRRNGEHRNRNDDIGTRITACTVLSV